MSGPYRSESGFRRIHVPNSCCWSSYGVSCICGGSLSRLPTCDDGRSWRQRLLEVSTPLKPWHASLTRKNRRVHVRQLSTCVLIHSPVRCVFRRLHLSGVRPLLLYGESRVQTSEHNLMSDHDNIRITGLGTRIQD